MGAEIEQLPDLAGYLKIASHRQWLRVGLRPMAPATRSPAVPTSAASRGCRHRWLRRVTAPAAVEGLEAGPY